MRELQALHRQPPLRATRAATGVGRNRESVSLDVGGDGSEEGEKFLRDTGDRVPERWGVELGVEGLPPQPVVLRKQDPYRVISRFRGMEDVIRNNESWWLSVPAF